MDLQQEWLALQSKFEAYEFVAWANKLAALLLLAQLHPGRLVLALVAVLWLQEAVLKTFQSRLGARLLTVEQGLRRDAPDAYGAGAMQLHSDWQAARPGTFKLLAQVLSQLLRPTVAFSYVLLLGLGWVRMGLWTGAWF
ncbi:hypothetical protein [Roseateles koreensis]|uniref:Uncharacterized protein n=1 Tax=Roseateles koreensis TaxID=2987526 RepID=A0ABT5KPW3_9BURK|nr:hypothetical protein [Roseateles koreensis]MDC8784948.1 hypothetical protein [Roseateles koreensis]